MTSPYNDIIDIYFGNIRLPELTEDIFGKSETTIILTKNKTKKVHENWKCAVCETSVTSQRRKGPQGKDALCNACGLKYAKNIKKKAREEKETEPAKKHKVAIETVAAPILQAPPPQPSPPPGSIWFLLN